MDKIIFRGMSREALWEKCVDFHGHSCPGLMIGFRAALYAAQIMSLDFSQDEQLVCIAENNACGVDAIQVVLGCSVGKGNLLFHMTGKQAFSIYERASKHSVRLLLHDFPSGLERAEKMRLLTENPAETLFASMPVRIEIPERARLFESYKCSYCGETTGANWLHIHDGRYCCSDCYSHYDTFNV